MKLLFLAPQPFFQDRGTPIAVRLAVEVLASRPDLEVDLLTYHEGKEIHIDHVNIVRAAVPRFLKNTILKNIGPGISLKKLLCDFFFVIHTFKLLWRNRNEQYDLIHSVEESVFIAWCAKTFLGIPYIYDMDSSMAMQVIEKWWLFKPLASFLQVLEGMAVKKSMAVVPVCDALAEIADRHGSKDTHILRDVSLLNFSADERDTPSNLRDQLGLNMDDVIVLYIGNLESYQGVDLLLESFSKTLSGQSQGHLVIIGGVSEHIEALRRRANVLGAQTRVHLLGPRPVSHLSSYLAQADILVSPRTKGNNTPMKIYSYLHSGKAILATNLPTHTQVLSAEVAALAEPEATAFSKSLLELIRNKDLRMRLGKSAFELAEREYTYEVFRARLNELYDRVDRRVAEPGQVSAS